MLGSANFLGCLISCAFTPRLGDIFGRKWPFILSGLLAFPALIIMITSTSLNITILAYLLLGLGFGGRVMIGFVYFQELLPPKSKTVGSLLFNLQDGVSVILLTIYFRFISDDYYWVFISFPAVNLLTLLFMACYAPESPVYLLTIGQKEKAKDSIRCIAARNGKQLSNNDLAFIDDNSPRSTAESSTD